MYHHMIPYRHSLAMTLNVQAIRFTVYNWLRKCLCNETFGAFPVLHWTYDLTVGEVISTFLVQMRF